MKTAFLAVPFAALVACGGGGGSGSGNEAPSAAQVQQFDAAAQAISTASSRYQATAASMPDHAACVADQAAYEAQVRPALAEMTGLAGAMDHGMTTAGQGADADVTCAAQAMAAELDLHAAIACASPTDMAPNEGEAVRHAQVMGSWADHQRIRAGQVGSTMGMGGMGGGMQPGATTGTCQAGADGTYTMGGVAGPAANETMVAGMHGSAEQIAAAAAAYGAAAAMADVAACRSDASSYLGQVRPLVEQMRAAAGAMDRTAGGMGMHPSAADMQCTADAMRWELDRHEAAACATPDVQANRTEAARHVEAMTRWTDHQRARSEALGATMGMSGMSGGGSTGETCQRNADGSYTLASAGMMR